MKDINVETKEQEEIIIAVDSNEIYLMIPVANEHDIIEEIETRVLDKKMCLSLIEALTNAANELKGE